MSLEVQSSEYQQFSAVQNLLEKAPGASREIRLLVNDPKNNQKVITTLENDLRSCKTFDISVAFVTYSGIEALKTTLDILRNHGIKGRLLTTDYLSFSQPAALKFLDSLENLEVRMYRCHGAGFHTKGYIFSSDKNYRIIIGSSNLTQNALTTNCEWNVHIVSEERDPFLSEVQSEFSKYWNEALPLAEVIDEYEAEYKEKLKDLRALSRPATVRHEKLKPNAMQEKFIESCLKLFHAGQKRALLISATGTGKTYAAAFAAKAILSEIKDHAPKLLFVVHREQIATKAMESFQKVLGDQDFSFGKYSGGNRQQNAQCIFATVQTMHKEANLAEFQPDHFDLIVLDEVHHAGAQMYQDILNYYKPSFCLGMTASPERTDGYNIFELFDHNIAYEIRLQTAMEQDLLCPFHYFGVTDIVIEKEDAPGEYYIEDVDSSTHRQDPCPFKGINALASDLRVNYILEKAEYYKYSGNRVKGLVFCSSLEECGRLSEQFNRRGYRTLALSGENSQSEREDAVERLQSDERPDQLDYIFTQDIFNEGIDIPEVNQVIMLRPTESPIIFLQQLGRGLRKSSEKEFVVILDFIGNYANSYLISVALSGDRSYDKDNMRRFTSVGAFFIPGVSSIHFDEITTERIYKSIDTAKTNSTALIKKSYENLKFRLGRIPTLMDFVDNNEIDPLKIIDKYGSYYTFLQKMEKGQYPGQLSVAAEELLTYCSSSFGNGQRPTEIALLQGALAGSNDLVAYAESLIQQNFGYSLTNDDLVSAIKLLGGDFFLSQNEKDKHPNSVLIEEQQGKYKYSALLEGLLSAAGGDELRHQLEELIAFALDRYTRTYFPSRYQGTDFSLNRKYSYADACRLFNWPQNINGQNIGGYKFDSDTKTFPIFVNYEKNDGTITYEDRFVDEGTFEWVSKHNRNSKSVDAQRVHDPSNRIYLFVRRNKEDNEAKAFYFLGRMLPVGEPVDGVHDDKPVFKQKFKLETPVAPEIYQYLTGGSINENH